MKHKKGRRQEGLTLLMALMKHQAFGDIHNAGVGKGMTASSVVKRRTSYWCEMGIWPENERAKACALLCWVAIQ